VRGNLFPGHADSVHFAYDADVGGNPFRQKGERRLPTPDVENLLSNAHSGTVDRDQRRAVGTPIRSERLNDEKFFVT
jgi:hypothetical protein